MPSHPTPGVIRRAWWWLWLVPACCVFWVFLVVVALWRGPSRAFDVFLDSLVYLQREWK